MWRWIPVLLAAGACKGPAEPAVIVLVTDGVSARDSFGEGLISVDGSSPEAMMPESWASLVPEAVRATSVWNLNATATATAHAALASGRRLPLANYGLGEDGEGVGLYRPDLPSLMEALRDQRGYSQREVLVTGNTRLIQPIACSLWPDSDADSAEFVYLERDGGTASDVEVLDFVLERARTDAPRFVLANLHETDRAGHYGEEGDYAARLTELDGELVDFWRALQRDRDYAGNTWLVVVSDHGRHLDADTDPPWRGHGDSCAGCRQLPLLILGPGVRAGEAVDAPLQLTDLAPTLAGLLDVELPWAEGLPAGDLFDRALPAGRSGVAEIAAAGPWLAEVRYLRGEDQRTRLFVGGEPLSSADAAEVAAPAMAWDGERAWLCFREFRIEPGADAMGWEARCLSRAGPPDGLAGGWREIAPPERGVGPFWSIALQPDGDGGLFAAWPHNPYGGPDGSYPGGDVAIRAGWWARDGWRVLEGEAGWSFPTDPAVAWVDGEALVAWGAGGLRKSARYERQVVLASARRSGWGEVDGVGLGGLVEAEWRLERPALSARGDAAHLAAVAVLPDGIYGAMAALRGGALQAVGLAALPGEVSPHLGPVWHGDRAVFTVIVDGEAQICAVGGPGEGAECVELGAERVLDLAAGDAGVYAVVDRGVGDWRLELLEI